jgi:hypothetical protein
MHRILAYAHTATPRAGAMRDECRPVQRKKARATCVARANVGYYPDYRFCTDT